MSYGAKDVERELKKLGTKKNAESSARFFKTGKDEYGRGDAFGVTVPNQRILASRFLELPFDEIARLLSSDIHECRLTALIILVLQFKRGDERERTRIVRFYLSHTICINNWDLVDASASYILGTYLLLHKRAVLYKLVKSKNLWERRIAIVATHALIHVGDTKDALALSLLLLSDKEDLMHKALGWTLREVGKQSRPALVKFLNKHVPHMPRTALRYSIEHFSEVERKKFMRMG